MTMTGGADQSFGGGGVFGKRPNALAHLLSQSRTVIMGVLNVTPDSFSGDGLLATGRDPVAEAVERGRYLVEEYGCVNCHRSMSASLVGRMGPDLTDIGSRVTGSPSERKSTSYSTSRNWWKVISSFIFSTASRFIVD